MVKSRKRSLHEHLVAIGIAVVLVAAVSVGINRSGMLTADITGNSATAAADADVSYSIANNALSIHSEKSFAGAKSLTFMVIYDPDTTLPEVSQMQTSHDYTSSSGKEGITHVTIFFSGMVAQGEQIAMIPLSGMVNDVTISDTRMLFTDGTIDGLAIRKQ